MTYDYTTYRNRHDRIESHFGTFEATLVELSSALGVDLPTGTTVEAAIAIIHERLLRLEDHDVYVFSLKADAVVSTSRMRAAPRCSATAAVVKAR